MGQVLKRELQTYARERERLLDDHQGEFVLIHGRDVIGCFGSEQEAVDEGYRQLGYVPFLVKLITPVEEPVYVAVHPVSG